MNEETKTTEDGEGTRYLVWIYKRQWQLIPVVALTEEHAMSLAIGRLKPDEWMDSIDDLDVSVCEDTR